MEHLHDGFGTVIEMEMRLGAGSMPRSYKTRRACRRWKDSGRFVHRPEAEKEVGGLTRPWTVFHIPQTEEGLWPESPKHGSPHGTCEQSDGSCECGDNP